MVDNRGRVRLVVLAMLVTMASGSCGKKSTPTPTPVKTEPTPTPVPASLEMMKRQVWHLPSGQPEREVKDKTTAGKGDRVWTLDDGRARLKWTDLWVELYRETDMQVKDVTPTALRYGQAIGTALIGGKPSVKKHVTWETDYAEIVFPGTILQITHHPEEQLTLVRVFDGQVEVSNRTGDVQTEVVNAYEWAAVGPDAPPEVSDDPELLRALASRLGLWDLFHQVELDVQNGFGPEGSQIQSDEVEIVFTTPPAAPVPVSPGSTQGSTSENLEACTEVVLRWEAAPEDAGGGSAAYYRVDLRQEVDGDWEPVFLDEDLYQLSVDVSDWVSQGEYAWRVFASDDAGNWSEASDWRYFECLDLTPPAAPESVGPGGTGRSTSENLESCTEVVLEWEAAPDNPGGSGTAYYRLDLRQEVDGDWEPVFPDEDLYELSVDVSDWVSEGEYAWSVSASDHAGNWSEASDWRYFECLDITPPAAPVSVGPGSTQRSTSESLESCAQVVLEWEAASDNPGGSGTAYYRLDLRQEVGGDWEPVFPDEDLYQLSVDVSGSVSEGEYAWSVSASDHAGNWSDASVWRYFECPDITPPAAPVPLGPGSTQRTSPENLESCTQVTLRWEAAPDNPGGSGTDHYRVDLRYWNGSEWEHIPPDQSLDLYGLSIDVSEWLSRGDYAWRVLATDGAGNWSEGSDWLYFECVDITPPAAPVALSPGTTQRTSPENLESCTQVTLRWKAAADNAGGSGIAYYRVDLRYWTSGQWEEIPPDQNLYGLSVNVSEWVSYGLYAWRIYARDNAGNWSQGSDWLYFECRDITPPPTPQAQSPGTRYSQSPEITDCPWTLRWTSVYDPSGVWYDVVLQRRSGSSWQQVNRWYPVYGTQQYVPDCSEYTRYRWTVRACDGENNCSGWSDWLYHSTSLW